MSVVGFDFGSLNCFISVARQGGIEVATNDYSLHATPSCVQFGARQRSMGVAARQSMMMNLKNTVTNFKNLIGRKFSDPIVQKELEYIPCQVVQLPEDNIGFKIDCYGETRVLSPEQVLSILLTKLKDSAGAFMNTKVTDCVLTVPCFWTDVQRRAALDATQVADLNCLRLVNETAATALAYGIYKQDLPAENEKPRLVAFVDVGYTATQACTVAFNKGKLKVLGASWDIGLGGREFDGVIRNHFRKEFMDKYKVDAKSTPKAWLRLLDESEKLKKLMSANSNPLPINIECFMNDKDVTGHMQRSDFEGMCKPLMCRLENVLTQLLQSTKIKPDDLEGVEIVGGSTRIPMVKEVIKRVFKKEPRTTLNQDESVSRGAALQCAMLSPTFRVREFSVSDAQPFNIKLTWSADKGDDGESEVFSENHPFPFSKMLTFFRKEPFELHAKYSLPNHIPYPKTQIGKWKIDKVGPSAEGDSSKVKVKVRINPNGLFAVTSASMYEKQAVTDDEKIDQNEENEEEKPGEGGPTDNGTQNDAEPMQTQPPPPAEGQAPADPCQDAGTPPGTAPPPAAEGPSPVRPARQKIKSIDLPIQESVTQLDAGQLQRLKKAELDMQKLDRAEKEKIDAKNALEEYVYDIREKLIDSLQPYVTPQDGNAFSAALQKMEDWLYGEGEDMQKKVYTDKLNDLKKTGDPIVERYQEALARPQAFDTFAQSLVRTRKAYQVYLSGDDKYAHIDANDMEKVRKALDEKQEWFERNLSATDKRQLTDVPAVFVHQIIQEREAFERIVTPILNRPKPKVEPPLDPPKKENSTGPAGTGDTDGQTGSTNLEANGDSKGQSMEVD